MRQKGQERSSTGLSFLSFFLPLLIYLITLCRDIYWLDSAEFVVVTRSYGLAHPPGYPLLLLLLHIVRSIPLLSLPFRINFVSALAAAGSSFVLYWIVYRLTRKSTPALFGAIIWATSFELWQQATVIEVYSLQVFLFALTIYAAIRYAETRTPGDIFPFAFSFGLALANHLFIVTSLPGFLVLLSSPQRHKLKFWQWVLIAVLMTLGPLLYISLLFRSRNLPSWGGVNSITEFISYITAGVYRYRFLAGGGEYLILQFTDFLRVLFRQFNILWILLIPGTIFLLREKPRLLVALVIGTVFQSIAVFAYNIPDKEGYFLPVYFLFAILLSLGIHWLEQKKLRNLLTGLIGVVLFILTVVSFPRQNRAGFHSLSDLGRTVLSELPDRAVLFTDDYSLVQILHWFNLGPDSLRGITVVSEHHLAFPWYLKQLQSRLPIPDSAFLLASQLWQKGNQNTGRSLGEKATKTIAEIKLILLSGLASYRVFYFPRDFRNHLEEWRNFRLKLHGLTYEFRPQYDSLIDPPANLTFPDPQRYRSLRRYDVATEDLCRRFAASINRRGMLRYAKGDITGALFDFNLSLTYYPEYSAAIENKGIVFALEGEPDSARFYLTKFLELEPNSQESDKVRMFLQKVSY